MKFTPIFPNNRELDLIEVIPAWEISEGPIFTSLDSNKWIPAHEFYLETASEEDKAAYQGKECYTDVPLTFLESARELIRGVREHLLTQTDYFYDNVWPSYKFRKVLDNSTKDLDGYTTIESFMDVWRDAPDYRQSVHLDNFGILATMVYNIKDNPVDSGTKYYKDFSLNGEIRPEYGSFIHQGPTKAGTGILHVNTPWAYHEGWNRSKEYREVAYWSLAW